MEVCIMQSYTISLPKSPKKKPTWKCCYDQSDRRASTAWSLHGLSIFHASQKSYFQHNSSDAVVTLKLGQIQWTWYQRLHKLPFGESWKRCFSKGQRNAHVAVYASSVNMEAEYLQPKQHNQTRVHLNRNDVTRKYNFFFILELQCCCDLET